MSNEEPRATFRVLWSDPNESTQEYPKEIGYREAAYEGDEEGYPQFLDVYDTPSGEAQDQEVERRLSRDKAVISHRREEMTIAPPSRKAYSQTKQAKFDAQQRKAEEAQKQAQGHSRLAQRQAELERQKSKVADKPHIWWRKPGE